MTKQEFLSNLQNKLTGLPQEDIEERLMFYSEMIDDQMEDGLSEETVIEGLGSVDNIVDQIVSEIPIGKLVKEKMRTKRRLSAMEIILIILGSPLWLSLLIAAFAVLLSVYIVLWALIISLWVVELAFILCTLAGIALGIVWICTGKGMEGIALIGAGIVLAGLSVFLFFACKAASKGAIVLTKKIAKGIKSLFIRKEKEK